VGLRAGIAVGIVAGIAGCDCYGIRRAPSGIAEAGAGPDSGALADASDESHGRDAGDAPPDPDGGTAADAAVPGDLDGDGHAGVESGGADCDDADPEVHPFADEREEWTTEVVDEDGGQYTSIALAADGTVHITYYDKEDGALRHAFGESGGWTRETVDDDSAGAWNSLALDATGALHVTYSTPRDPELRYATNVTGSWQRQILERAGNAGPWSSIAIDADGRVHVAFQYSSSGDLGFATNASGPWTFETVDWFGWKGSYAALGLSADGSAHIAYLETWFGGAEDASVLHATNASGDWTTEEIEAHGGAPAIGIGDDGVVHVVFADRDDGLTIADDGAGAWEVGASSGLATVRNDLAVAAQGLHVVSEEAGADFDVWQDVVYSTYGSAWSRTRIDRGLYPSIALGDDGALHVAYWNRHLDELMYARRDLPDGVDQDCNGVD